jgi:hypothetical protein
VNGGRDLVRFGIFAALLGIVAALAPAPWYETDRGTYVAIGQRWGRDPTPVRKRGRQFWLDLAATHFRVADWYGITRYLLPGGCYLNWPSRWLRRHTPAVAVVARMAPTA